MLKSVALIALFAFWPQPIQAPKGTDTTKGISAQRGSQGDTATGDQQASPPPTPPINTAAAQTSPQELEADRQEREREITIQAQNRTFTGLLVIVAAVTAGVVGWQAYETRQAANAARLSVAVRISPPNGPPKSLRP